MQDKLIARRIISVLNKVKKQEDVAGFNLVDLFKQALQEQGVQMENLMPSDTISQKVTFKSGDLKISGIIFKNKESKKWIIGAHGYSSNKESMANLIWPMYKMGYNLFLFDFRNHGESDDSLITFGINEVDDLDAALDYLNKTYEVDSVGLYGASMGAYTVNRYVLMKHDNFKKYHIKFGISDSTYIDIVGTMKDLVKSKFPSANTGYLADEIVEVYKENGIDFKVGNLEIVGLSSLQTVPMLFFHGKNDLVTNYNCSSELYEIRKDIEGSNDILKIFDEGPHLRSFVLNQDKYLKTIEDFLIKVGE